MCKYLVIFIISFLALAAPAFADDGVIGTILEVEGSGAITPSSGGTPVTAGVDMPVHLNDTVQTRSASRIFILFIDNTKMTLGENTSIRIDNYIFDPDDKTNNKASYSVLAGAFQYVSGLIGKKENPDVHIDTPVGTIGIRGTDFWAGNLDNQYSVAVNEGQVALKTDAGETVVNKGEGTSVRDRHSVPSRATAWPRERFARISSTVHLRRQAMVQDRIGAMQGRQRFLRWRYKNYMAQHNSLIRAQGEGHAENRFQTKHENRLEKRRNRLKRKHLRHRHKEQ